MEISICRRCKGIFNYKGGTALCPKCIAEEQEIFYRVKDYLSEHKSATIEELNSATQVGIKLIKKFIKEGRLELIEASNIKIECQRCGADTYSGRYCNKCKKEIYDEINGINTATRDDLSLIKQSQKNGMHTQFSRK